MKHPMDETIASAMGTVDQLTQAAGALMEEGQALSKTAKPKDEWQDYFNQAHHITTAINSLLLGILIYVCVDDPGASPLADVLFNGPQTLSQ